MQRGYIDTPEGCIHYRAEGSGKPLLMLHMAGSSSNQFADVIPILGQRCRVIAIDILGYGSSDFPPHIFQIEDYARNVIHVLDAFNIGRADVVGRYTGAAIALEIAATCPERVDKLILQALDYLEPEAQKERQEFYKHEGMNIRADGSHIMKWWNERISRYNMTPELAHRALVDYLQAGQGLRAEDGHRALYAYDMRPKLPLIKSPTLLLWGAGDVCLDRMEPARRLIPRCRTRVIAEAWNYPPWSKPQDYAESILEFLNNPGV